jgi:hypothetical protein
MNDSSLPLLLACSVTAGSSIITLTTSSIKRYGEQEKDKSLRLINKRRRYKYIRLIISSKKEINQK